MQRTYQTIIIGGGASGLLCAVELLNGENALFAKDVLILERNDRVGKKLITTGNGQGNLMNENFGTQFYRGEKSFISAFVESTNKIDLEKYLYNLGIPLCTLSSGKKYPISRQASAVLDIIRENLNYHGLEVKTEEYVTDVSKKGDVFLVKTKNSEFYAKNVVLAVGGACAKQFGTDGSSYKLAEKFGHVKTNLIPSLVQLKTDTSFIKGLKGLKEIARVTALVDGKEKMTATGDLLFTDYGVSGNTIFQVSAVFSDKGNQSLKIEFLPDFSIQEVEKLIEEKLSKGYIKEQDVLTGLLVKRIAQTVQKLAKSNSAKDLAFAIKNFNLKVTGNMGFNYAQVTKGGIKTDTVNPHTMESKLKSGLYLTGEMLDVDGDCGGYNITFAFASGISSARDIKNRLKNG